MKLNADLGENEPPTRTRALLGLVDLANIACGGHAGTLAVMTRTVSLAVEKGVAIGAHPGLSAAFGRGSADLGPADLALVLAQQAGGLAAVVRAAGGTLHHIKLHGSLYHVTERSSRLARAYVETVARLFPGVAIVALARGRVVRAARAAGVPALAEVFAERGVCADGSLIPRGESGDLITDPREVSRRVPALRGDTICVHADTPNAVAIARAVRTALKI